MANNNNNKNASSKKQTREWLAHTHSDMSAEMIRYKIEFYSVLRVEVVRKMKGGSDEAALYLIAPLSISSQMHENTFVRHCDIN